MFPQAVVIASLFGAPPEPRVVADADYALSVERTAAVAVYARDGSDLAAALGLRKAVAESAAAKALGVGRIDWTRYAVVVVSGGVREGMAVRILDPRADGDTLIVRWRLVDSDLPRGRRHPARLALVERHAGPVRFQETLVRWR
jgi:hypothetical protein